MIGIADVEAAGENRGRVDARDVVGDATLDSGTLPVVVTS